MCVKCWDIWGGVWGGTRAWPSGPDHRRHFSSLRLGEEAECQKGTEEAMSAVDLSRVGACVLKHAVTGEVRHGALPTHMG